MPSLDFFLAQNYSFNDPTVDIQNNSGGEITSPLAGAEGCAKILTYMPMSEIQSHVVGNK